MKDNSLPIVGISCGDPNGIGIEIILKSLKDERISRVFYTCYFFKRPELLSSQKKLFNLQI